jgi:flagellar protein FlbD
MISVTRLDGSAIILNADLIMTIERTPDTLVALTTGDRMLLRETPEQIVDRITRYRRELTQAGSAVAVSESGS